MLKLINVSKKYTDRQILNNINIEFQSDNINFLIGPSGSGKTTLFNIITGLDKSDQGDIYLDEKKLSALSDQDFATLRLNFFGLIFQTYNFLPSLKIIDNILLPNKLIGDSKNPLNLTKKLGIDHILNQYPDSVSGGELQRAAIARALINNPSLLIADEPTGNLDQENAHIFMKTIRKIQKTNNMTIVIITHDINLITKEDFVYDLSKDLK
ncbi:UNVERIFIED_CONTAM: hypothetical protein GTU68_048836 [Idotea baltica]|nr:hypothetical protein [Idotea baltica]